MAVWMSRHPSLNASISDALVALRPHLMRGVVEAVIVALLDQAGAVVEQYAFDVDVDAAVDVAATYRCGCRTSGGLAWVPRCFAAPNCGRASARSALRGCTQPRCAAMPLLAVRWFVRPRSHTRPRSRHLDTRPPSSHRSDVETLLASALTRIALLEAAMLPVPRGTTFTLLVATHDALQGPQSDADEGAGAAGAGGGGTGVLGAGSGWSRVDPGDPEAALTLLGGGAGGGGADATEPVSAALKTIRAGRMAIDVRLVHRR